MVIPGSSFTGNPRKFTAINSEVPDDVFPEAGIPRWCSVFRLLLAEHTICHTGTSVLYTICHKGSLVLYNL